MTLYYITWYTQDKSYMEGGHHQVIYHSTNTTYNPIEFIEQRVEEYKTRNDEVEVGIVFVMKYPNDTTPDGDID